MPASFSIALAALVSLFPGSIFAQPTSLGSKAPPPAFAERAHVSGLAYGMNLYVGDAKDRRRLGLEALRTAAGGECRGRSPSTRWLEPRTPVTSDQS